ncbi:Helo-like-N domain-containing protein [Fusarium falciforme]|uniref:Helo-like-N domain-containing protein n=1 Tax=Fusarium falciforme TaxID=195108 RepID=UPI002301348C|nr:Helo-like-N domain-containing protein [Fusarium falciforme]WAO92359.1 Helo-like-N domain-containing protein [Fusarium falciforme]
MDPLSITTACVALLAAVSKTTLAVTDFVRDCREARSDLAAITGELSQLHLVLELLKDDAAVSDDRIIPESLQVQILSIIENCSAVVVKINTVLQSHAGRAGVIKWTPSHIPQIIEELTRLRAIIAAGEILPATSGQNYVLQQYLDGLTSYAETVCNDVVWDSDSSVHAISRTSSREDMTSMPSASDTQRGGNNSFIRLPTKSSSDEAIPQVVAVDATPTTEAGAFTHVSDSGEPASVAESISLAQHFESPCMEEEQTQSALDSAAFRDPSSIAATKTKPPNPPNVEQQVTIFRQGRLDDVTKSGSPLSSLRATTSFTKSELKSDTQDGAKVVPIAESTQTLRASSQAKILKKLLIVGDSACGKSVLLSAFLTGIFKELCIPTVFENYVADVEVDGKHVELALWDTSGISDYDPLRRLVYPDSDIVLICFAIDYPDSLHNIQEKWIGEVMHFCPDVPYFLVGLKKELRNDVKTIEDLKATNQQPVSWEEGQEVARKIAAVEYFECSVKTGEGEDKE